MERYSIFMGWKYQYCENATKCNLQIQSNPYQITNGNFHRTRTNNFTIHIETEKTLKVKAILRKKNLAGGINFLDFRQYNKATGIKTVSVQFSSVAQSLCDPMNCSTTGLPVHHQLPEFTQTHVHQVGDAVQPSHPLSSPFLLPLIPPSIRVFSNESTLRMRWTKYWSFSFSIIPSKEHPGQISFRMDWLDLLAV